MLSACVLVPFVSASAANAKVVFEATEPDAEGLFTVNVTAYNATFDALQFSMNYDNMIVTPVAVSTGEATKDIDAFTQMGVGTEKLKVYGYIPSGEDLINFTGIAYPEDAAVISPDDYYLEAGSEGRLIATFSFKLLKEGASGLALATSATGKSYNISIPNGLEMSKAGISKSVDISFQVPQGLSGTSEAKETKETIMTDAAREEDTIILQIGNYAAAKEGALCHIYPGEKQVAPYIRTDAAGNDRTMVPARFIAESLGAAVNYNDPSKTVTISLNGTVVMMTIGSSNYTVNGETKTMDAAPELKDCGDGSGNSRTMVPMRFIAESLGKAVYWDQSNKLVIITDPDVPWQPDRSAEQDLTADVLLVISPLLRDIIQ
jgi:hypothetical protein